MINVVERELLARARGLVDALADPPEGHDPARMPAIAQEVAELLEELARHLGAEE